MGEIYDKTMKSLKDCNKLRYNPERCRNIAFGLDTDSIDAMRYSIEDILQTKRYINNRFGFGIEKVIFNDPATIVFWTDGDKTVVKRSEGEEFDFEKGLAMAISKKFLGDNYRKTFKKWIPEEEDTITFYADDVPYLTVLADSILKMGKKFNKKEEKDERKI